MAVTASQKFQGREGSNFTPTVLCVCERKKSKDSGISHVTNPFRLRRSKHEAKH
jgi:hypothetical protein